MDRLDDLVDDYLRAVIHARPWTKRKEEAALTPLSRWVADTGVDFRAALEDGPSELAEAYGRQADLTPEERERIQVALGNFVRWARREGYLAAEPELRPAHPEGVSGRSS
jgi:hypothetical protein